MDNFIYELLTNNKSVILPDFGSLSYTDEEKGTVMFNPYIKFNDGKLEKFLCEKHGLEKQDAVNRIAKFLKDLELKVNTGEPYSIFQVGRFVKTAQGDIDFESWGTYESVGAPPAADIQSKMEEIEGITAQKETWQESNPTENEVTKTITEEFSPLTEPEPEKQVKKEVITAEEVESIKPVYEKPADRTLSVEETKQTQNKFTPSQEENKSEITEAEEPKEKKTITEAAKSAKNEEKRPRKKQGVGIYILAFILLTLGGTVTYVGFNLEEVKQWIGLTEEVAEDNVVQDNPTTEEDQSVELVEDDDNTVATDDFVEEEESVETTPPTTNPSPQSVNSPVSEGNFHIIVGSFGNPENANNLANSLKSKGYPAQVIGPVNNMHMVSFGAFHTREAAQAELEKATQETGGGWIMKR